MQYLKLRIILGIFLFVSLFITPFWISGIAVIAGVIIIPYYWEALVFLACVDLLYGGGASLAVHYWYPTAMILVFLAVEIIRGYLRENSDVR